MPLLLVTSRSIGNARALILLGSLLESGLGTAFSPFLSEESFAKLSLMSFFGMSCVTDGDAFTASLLVSGSPFTFASSFCLGTCDKVCSTSCLKRVSTDEVRDSIVLVTLLSSR